MGTILLVLISATIVEKAAGTEVAVRYIYTAPWTIALWLVAVFFAVWHLADAYRHHAVAWATLLLHLSFVVMLGGALLTHLTGQEGTIHLRTGESGATYYDRHGQSHPLPFSIRLTDFQVINYPGTSSPMDYRSSLRLISLNDSDPEMSVSGEISMNEVLRKEGWRICQSGYDKDELGAVFALSYDPFGIGVTYTGYALLLVSMVLFFFQRNSRFRSHWRRYQELAAMVCLLLLPGQMADAQTTLPALQRPVANSFGRLYVEYNGRICPMSSLATDVCLKLFGRHYYTTEDGRQLNANQVFTGILFYPDQWQNVPLKQSRKPASNAERKEIFRMVASGAMLRIWPGQEGWYTPDEINQHAEELTEDDWRMQSFSLQYVAYDLAQGHNIEANQTLQKMRIYQQEQAGNKLPSERKFRAEEFFKRTPYSRPLGIAAICIGLVLFVAWLMVCSSGRSLPRWTIVTAEVLMLAAWLLLSFMLGLRWYISGYVPLSNGHETMQALAWLAMLLTLVCLLFMRKKSLNNLLLCFGWLISGLALLVSMMTAANPQLTSLMPVLQSPLLSLHVGIIMLSYALLFFVALNSLSALIIQRLPGHQGRNETAYLISMLLLYPALFCLTIGIFLGAIWANISWGSYWNWDPKEVWALITMLIYAIPFHGRSLPRMQNERTFHRFCVLAFLSVLITYFGVNFFLGGMHSYA